MRRPIQRVGHIGDDDNRFFGEAVFAELAHRVVQPIDILLIAFGVRHLEPADHELLRCLSLACVSPDARVWPLKLARILASFGNAYAGHFGAQLAHFSERMGPGTASMTAASLEWIAARVAEGTSVADAVANHAGRIGGFGVPFRAQDERLLGLAKLLADHPARARPMWKLHEQVVAVMREEHQIEPNVVFPMTAILLDLGIPARRTGIFLSILLTPTFAAHALEAADQDAPYLREIPPAAIEYRGRPARSLP